MMKRRLINSAVACALVLCAGFAAAENDKLKETFKKTERGFGGLLESMGHELKKAQKKISKPAKKQDKEERRQSE